MTTVQQWGRRESIIWPPRGFYYTYGAIFLAIVAAGFLIYVRYWFVAVVFWGRAWRFVQLGGMRGVMDLFQTPDGNMRVDLCGRDFFRGRGSPG